MTDWKVIFNKIKNELPAVNSASSFISNIS